MKLLVRLDSLVHPRTGIGYYTEHLVRHLVNDHLDCEVTGLYMGQLVRGQALINLLEAKEGVGRSYVERLGGLGKVLDTVRPIVRGIPGAYAIRQKLQDARAERVMGAEEWDIYHEPSFIPLRSQVPTVVTIHDLSHIRFPEYHPTERVKFLDKHLGQAIRDARHIITVSEFTKTEVCHFFPEAEGKITAIPLGVDPIFRPRSVVETAGTLEKWQLDYGNYILSVATQEPRKNLTGLIRAYLDLPEEVRLKTPLVLVGGKGWRSKEFLRLVEFSRHETGRIVVTGRVNRLELAELVSGCKLFAYPSFYEGFGLPIAEALASGVRVLTSNYGAMREVAGHKAWLVDPYEFSEDLLGSLFDDSPVDEYSATSWQEVAVRTGAIFEAFVTKGTMPHDV